jgi:L,D-transpeptidase YcbB
MNKFVVCLFAAFAGVGLCVPALAQDMASLPTRIVIAPPQSTLASTIKAGLAQAYSATAKGSPAYREAQKLYFFYGQRHFEPIWLDEGPTGAVAFSASARKILKLFENAAAEGLRPADYLTPDLALTALDGDPAGMAALETAFSRATMRYATHIHTGRIDPQSISVSLDIKPKTIDETALLVELAGSDDPAAVLAELEPSHPEFLALKAALARLDAGDVDRPVAIPDGAVLKPGMSDPRIPLLRTRLELPADPSLVYDEALVTALKAFQESLGLDPDGVAGPATIAALNGGAATSRDDILANMERWRWMPSDLGRFNVFVNIPEFRLAINRDNREEYTTRVVVGTTKNQTPIFSDNIRHIVVNPYWNVPSSIITGEIAPKTRANPNYIANQNMELLYNGNVVSASQVNWSQVGSSFPFRVRQRPGPGNSLGQIKFLFPNKHDVYLHDTPSKSLFSRSSRAFSHGCVRVQNPMEFADALLVDDTTVSRASLEAMFGPSERWVNPERTIPVHIAYFTLRIAPDGSIRSFGDIYGHNAKLIEAMNR